MGFIRHSHKSRELFTLSAGGDYHDFIGRMLLDFLNRDDVRGIHKV